MKTVQIIFIVFVVGIVMLSAGYFLSLKNSSVQTTQKDNSVVSSPTPATVGVPLIVATSVAHAPETPVGKPVMVAPVAPVVE